MAIDGKTLRRSHDKSLGRNAIHMVSAWASQAGVSLGHVSTDEKSNEITAIPKLLEPLSLKGCIVTLDAMGCQRAIAGQIIDEKEADYVLALKGNQGTLEREVTEYFESIFDDGWEETDLAHLETTDGDHGRIETRKYWMSDDVPWFEDHPRWSGLQSFIAVDSTREVNGKVSQERRHFISSLPRSRSKGAFAAVRRHWGVENHLHWTLDVAFREDDCRIRKANAAQNAATVRNYALNLLNKEKTAKVGVKTKRLKAANDMGYLEKVLRFA